MALAIGIWTAVFTLPQGVTVADSGDDVANNFLPTCLK
jgi:hypothetical protein